MQANSRAAILAGVLTFGAALTASAGISNGDFESGLSDWSVSGDVSTFLLDSDNVAVFGENTNSAFSSIQQSFTIAANATTLVFDYFIDTEGAFNNQALRDALSARLLDPSTLNPLLSTTARQDYFYHQVPDDPTPAEILFDAALVDRTQVTDIATRPDWWRVAVDLTGLQGSNVLFEIGLLRGANGQNSFALVDNIKVNVTDYVIPAPAAAVLGLVGLVGVMRRRRG